MKNKRAVVSLPDYHTFFTTFTLPPMTKEEITEAVKFEAPVRIPLPVSKVSLDWQVVEGLGKGEHIFSHNLCLKLTDFWHFLANPEQESNTCS